LGKSKTDRLFKAILFTFLPVISSFKKNTCFQIKNIYNLNKKEYFFEFFSNWKKYSPIEWEWMSKLGDEFKI